MKLSLSQFNLTGLDAGLVQTLVQEYSALAEGLSDASKLDNWELSLSRGTSKTQVFVRLVTRDNPAGSIAIERTFDLKGKVLEHSMFSISRQLQSKGLADQVLATSVRIMDKLKWTKIQLQANLDVGGYAWMRKGFFPNYSRGNAANVLLNFANGGGKDFVALSKRVAGMKDAEVRAFVLSDEFRKYKKLYLGADWEGAVDLSDAAQRKALLKGTNIPSTNVVKPANKLDPPEPKPVVPPRTRATRAAPAGSLTNATVRHQVHLERLKTSEARNFNKVLGNLQTRIDQALLKLGGEVRDLPRAKLNQLLRELKAAQGAAIAKAQDELLERFKNIATYEAEFEAASIKAVAPASLPVVAATAKAAWTNVTTTPMSATGDLVEPFIRDLTSQQVDEINKVILRGYSEGWDNYQITRVLRGTKAQNFKDGLLTKLGKNNSSLVRTAVQHVSSQAREATWVENDVEKYRLIATLDGRTTSQCRSLDGHTFVIGQGPRAPLHINCRTAMVPIISGLENLSDSLTRASKDGQVKGSMTYYEWLKTQDVEFQNGVLGPARGKLFRDGGLSAERFSQLQLNSVFEPMSLEEMKKMEPLAFQRAGILEPT